MQYLHARGCLTEPSPMVKLNADQPAQNSQQYLLTEPLFYNKQGFSQQLLCELQIGTWPSENGEGRNQRGKHGMKESSSRNKTGFVRRTTKRVPTSHQQTAGKQSFASPTGVDGGERVPCRGTILNIDRKVEGSNHQGSAWKGADLSDQNNEWMPKRQAEGCNGNIS